MRLHAVLRLLGLACVAGCATATGASVSAAGSASKAEPAPVALVKPHGIPGETIEYEFTLRGFPIGRAVVAVGELGWVEGRRAIIVRARGQSAGLAAVFAEMIWEQQTTLDWDRGYAIAMREEVTIVWQGERDRMVHTMGDERAHDVISAVGAVRAWRSVPDQRARLDVRLGYSSIDTTVVDAGREFLAGPDRPAVKYRGTFNDEFQYSAWVSDDTARVPLRFETDTPLGSVTAELVGYHAPRD